MEVQSPGAPSVVPQNSSTSSSIPSSSEVSSLPTSISPMNLENLDKECSALAGLFQQTVNDMKVGLLNPKKSIIFNWFQFFDFFDSLIYNDNSAKCILKSIISIILLLLRLYGYTCKLKMTFSSWCKNDFSYFCWKKCTV